MDEDTFEAYSQWAEDELIWGKGMFNWCRAYSKEEWEKPATYLLPPDDDTEIPF
jgi:hypothetical protein